MSKMPKSLGKFTHERTTKNFEVYKQGQATQYVSKSLFDNEVWEVIEVIIKNGEE